MNVNTIIFGGRYRVSADGSGKIKTVHDPVTDRTLTLTSAEVFDAFTTKRIEALFASAPKENTNA